MPSLYDLNREIALILDSTNDDGELLPEVEARLDQLELAQPVKVDSICCAIAQFDSDATALAEEAKRLLDRSKAIAGRHRRLKDYLKFCLESAGIKKLETHHFTVWIQSNPMAFDLAPGVTADMFPDELCKITREFSKAKAKEYFEANNHLPGGVIASRGTSLRIK